MADIKKQKLSNILIEHFKREARLRQSNGLYLPQASSRCVHGILLHGSLVYYGAKRARKRQDGSLSTDATRKNSRNRLPNDTWLLELTKNQQHTFINNCKINNCILETFDNYKAALRQQKDIKLKTCYFHAK